MRIAAGDGNTADPMSPYCALYPGSGAENILSRAATAHVNEIGRTLLDYADMMAFDELVEGKTVVFTFEGGKSLILGSGTFEIMETEDAPN